MLGEALLALDGLLDKSTSVKLPVVKGGRETRSLSSFPVVTSNW